MTAKIKRSEAWHDDARQAVRVLRAGGILLHATDTVWGLACDATNDEAVKRLIKAGQREWAGIALKIRSVKNQIESDNNDMHKISRR